MVALAARDFASSDGAVILARAAGLDTGRARKMHRHAHDTHDRAEPRADALSEFERLHPEIPAAEVRAEAERERDRIWDSPELAGLYWNDEVTEAEYAAVMTGEIERLRLLDVTDEDIRAAGAEVHEYRGAVAGDDRDGRTRIVHAVIHRIGERLHDVGRLVVDVVDPSAHQRARARRAADLRVSDHLDDLLPPGLAGSEGRRAFTVLAELYNLDEVLVRRECALEHDRHENWRRVLDEGALPVDGSARSALSSTTFERVTPHDLIRAGRDVRRLRPNRPFHAELVLAVAAGFPCPADRPLRPIERRALAHERRRLGARGCADHDYLLDVAVYAARGTTMRDVVTGRHGWHTRRVSTASGAAAATTTTARRPRARAHRTRARRRAAGPRSGSDPGDGPSGQSPSPARHARRGGRR